MATMSTKKITEVIDFHQVCKRLINYLELSTQGELSDLFNLKKQDFSKRKRSGSLLPFIVKFGIENNIDLNWLLTGNESPSFKFDNEDINRKFTDIESRLSHIENHFNISSTVDKKGKAA